MPNNQSDHEAERMAASVERLYQKHEDTAAHRLYDDFLKIDRIEHGGNSKQFLDFQKDLNSKLEKDGIIPKLTLENWEKEVKPHRHHGHHESSESVTASNVSDGSTNPVDAVLARNTSETGQTNQIENSIPAATNGESIQATATNDGIPPTVTNDSTPTNTAGDGSLTSVPGGGEMLNGQPIFQEATWLTSAPSGDSTSLNSLVGNYSVGLQTQEGGYNYPVQTADGSLGSAEVNITIPGWSNPQTSSVEVPIPAGGFQPSTGTDGHLVIADPTTGKYYDFWQFKSDGNGNYTAASVGVGDLNGNGTPGTTAANISGLAGVVSATELDSTAGINHALNVVADQNLVNTIVGNQSSATKTDGVVPGAPLSEGSKISIPASVNLEAMYQSGALTQAGYNLAKAFQNYGGVITDKGSTNGGFEVYTTGVQSPPQLGSGWSDLMQDFVYTQ